MRLARARAAQGQGNGLRLRGVLVVVLVAAVVPSSVIGLSAAPASAGCSLTVSGISPAAGFLAGGATTTLTGCGFTQSGTLSVTFGSTAATPVTVASATSLSVAAPAAAAAGAVTVTVRLHPATGNDQTATAGYTYVASPAITSLLPPKGPEKGGTSVAVSGSHLSPGGGATTSAKFGATSATTVSSVTDTGLTAVSPGGTGSVNVTVVVTLPGGATATSNGLPYRYVPAPVVTSVSPTSGPPTGGQDVTLVGSGFQPGAQVLFGPSDGTTSLRADAPANPVSVLDSSHILATSPHGVPGASNVVVRNPDGQTGALDAAASGHYAFTGALPTIATVAPASGTSLGATSFTITGTGFLPGAAVAFQAPAQINPPSAGGTTVNGAGTQITGTTPAHAPGAVDVVVSNPGGGTVTLTGGYTYDAAGAPTITAVGALSQGTDSSLGGGQLTITGTNFASGAQVTFGATPAPIAAVLNATSILVTTPPHAAGTVDVAVTNPDTQAATATGAFTYVAAPAPTIISIAPSTGPSGTEVTITGTGFANTVVPTGNAAAPATVTVGTARCTPTQNASCLLVVPAVPPAVSAPIVRSATEIQGLVPNAPGGAVTVTVANPDGQSATTTFTYTGPSGTPTLASVSPATGPSLGDTTVTLAGTNFVAGTAVSFGGNNAATGATTVSSDGTTITTVTPAGTYGLVDVTVTSPGGAAATKADGFTFTTSPAPTITSVSPGTGPGGTPVTITGTGFANTNGASTNSTSSASVTIGGQALLPLAATPSASVVVNTTTIEGTVQSEPGGAVDVAVVNPDGQGAILTGGYTYPTDTTAPITTATAAAAGSDYPFGTWAPATVTVTLTADDHGGSGVKNIAYRATGAQPIPLTTVPVNPVAPGTSVSFPITANGATTVSFQATDLAGNVGASQDETVMVDTVKPAITAAATVPGAGGGTAVYTSGSVTDQNVTISLSCTDGGSGVSSVTDTTAGGAVTASAGTNPLDVTVTSQGANQSVTGTCTDVAGNTNSTTFSGIDISRDAPSVAASATSGGRPYTAGSWTDQPVTVTFTCTPLSASEQIASLTAPVQVAGPVQNQTVSGSCTDFAGNSSSVTFGTPSAAIDIDLTRPVATASATTTTNGGQTVPYTAGMWSDHDVTVTFACTDPGPVSSGVDTVAAPVTVTAPGVTSGVVGGCSDTAGNNADPPAFFGPVLIDKTPPSCTVSVNPNPIHPPTGRLTPVTATVKVSDAASGPNGFILVSVTSNHPTTATKDIVGFTPGTASTTGKLMALTGRVYTFVFQGFDVAGNSSAMCTATVKVTLAG